MTPIVGHLYTGPLGQRYMVTAIEGGADEMQWVAIRSSSPGCGTIRFPIWDAAKWLEPMADTATP